MEMEILIINGINKLIFCVIIILDFMDWENINELIILR